MQVALRPLFRKLAVYDVGPVATLGTLRSPVTTKFPLTPGPKGHLHHYLHHQLVLYARKQNHHGKSRKWRRATTARKAPVLQVSHVEYGCYVHHSGLECAEQWL